MLERERRPIQIYLVDNSEKHIRQSSKLSRIKSTFEVTTENMTKKIKMLVQEFSSRKKCGLTRIKNK